MRGQSGVSFYGNERDRGDLDQIYNYWIVRGLQYGGDEGTDEEGCSFAFVAVANTDHAKLGPGVDVGPQEFQSDLIQSEALAKAIAQRLMRWHNREPDVLRIQCGNDARVGPGQLVTVKDPSVWDRPDRGQTLPRDRRDPRRRRDAARLPRRPDRRHRHGRLAR